MKNITLHCNVMLQASGNFRRALPPLCFDLGRPDSGLVCDRTQASIWHPHVSGFDTVQPYNAGSTDKSDWSI
jgi:hypothetical protein